MLDKIELLCESIVNQFNSRTFVEGKKKGVDFDINLSIERKHNALWITFSKNEESHSIHIPISYEKFGIELIEQNEVKRAVCKYFAKETGKILEYIDVIRLILLDDPTGFISSFLVKKTPCIQQIIYSFINGSASNTIYNIQKAIDEITHRLPLYTTNMNSWVINRRLIIIDPEFDEIQSPQEKLEYQIEKSKKYFDNGWTSMGLSDGVLSDKNYILTCDLKQFAPFGIKFHNPQRNLYSTLGMKGDELPLVRSKSMQNLVDKGITRTGWNLFTMFVDIPDVWEDQIMIDESHKNKSIAYTKRFQCFGEVLIKVGDFIKPWDTLSISPDGQPCKFVNACDKAWVSSITEAETNIGGVPTKVHNVIVSFKCNLKDGTKITNLAANKGVIRFKELGYAIDPRTKEKRKIDIIVSSKAVQKRRNYSQILEALLNNVNGEKVIVLDNDVETTITQIEGRLEKEGFPKDGTWECNTYMGKLKGICGTVFWGVTHDVETAIWKRGSTEKKNNRDLRTAGIKFSTVEFRALTTRFGNNNPIIDEILSYAQGSEDLHEEIKILKSKIGELPKEKSVIDVSCMKAIDHSTGIIIPKETFEGTIADENFLPDGFILKLPVNYQVIIDKNHKVLFEGVPQIYNSKDTDDIYKAVVYNKIYIPAIGIRRPWRHSVGKYGLSQTAALINNIIIIGQRHLSEPEKPIHIAMLYRAIHTYFKQVANMMGSKRGDISVYGMAVRYPFSVKAVATLSNNIPKNTVMIHKSMADQLLVNDGDVVLVERFPCLGFMSLRPQKIRVTTDEKCKYTIRVSSNSLGSLGLDFDGDVIYLASFHTKEAKKALSKEWTNPNKSCYRLIQQLNNKMGTPHIKEMTLQDYTIIPFPPLTKESHASIVAKATGVKSHTGPVIALVYNIMRLVENSAIKKKQKANCTIEMFLDRVANSIFKQKHGVKPLHNIVIDAICSADIDILVKEGFDRSASTIICNTIVEKAASLGITNLKQYHLAAKAKKRSTIINRIVREENKIYFASRATLEGCELLYYLKNAAVDIPSKVLHWVMSGKAEMIKTPLEKHVDNINIKELNSENSRAVCSTLFKYMDSILRKADRIEKTKKAILKVIKS